ncbi:hypothetical protein MRX96_012613 [Rhipicephalus microplus]
MRQPPRRSWPGKAAGIINSASSLGSRTAPRARPACGGAVSLKGGERKEKEEKKNIAGIGDEGGAAMRSSEHAFRR